jgi:hypothetical protein
VRHRRFAVVGLELDGVPFPLRVADLVVARHDNGTGIEWECIAAGGPEVLERGPYALRMATDEGRVLGGDVVLVRSFRRGHVFRGIGDLHGLRPGELER